MNSVEWHEEQMKRRRASKALDKIAYKRTQEIIMDLRNPINVKKELRHLGEMSRAAHRERRH